MATTTIYSNKDSVIGEPSYGAGVCAHLPIGWNTWLGGDSRCYIGFNYSFSGWTAINSATLYLRTSTGYHIGSSVWSDPDIYIDLVTSSWSEGTAGESWSSANAIRWNSGLPSVSSTNRVTWDVGGGSNPSTSTTYSVDITGILQQAFASGAFYGIRLMAVVEGSGGDRVEFHSEEAGVYQPRIVIDYSTNTAPTEPTRTAPSNGSVVNTLTPTLAGNFNDPDAGDYTTGVQIVVYESNGTTVKWDSGGLSASGTSFSKTYAGPTLTGNTTYKWKARMKDAAGVWGAYNSTLWSFIANTVPSQPSISLSQTPVNDVLTQTPTFNVTHVDSDPGDTKLYGYQIDLQTSGGSAIWNSGQVTSTAVTTKSVVYPGSPTLNWGGSYRWRAKTKDINGAWGAYNTVYASFTLHQTSIPTSLSPTGGATVGSTTPTLSGVRGNANDSLVGAWVEIWDSAGTTRLWESGYFTAGVTSTSFSKISGITLTADTDYKWRASVNSSIGGASAWSAMQSFHTPAATDPSGTAPVGTGITDTTPDYTFNRATSFNRHRLYVYDNYTDAAANTTANAIWSDLPTTYTSTTSKIVTHGGTALSYGGTYWWRVAVSADGGSNYSSYIMIEFTLDAAGIPTLTSPIDNAWITTTTPSLQGTTFNSETIVTFRIKVYTDSQGTNEIYDSGNVAGSGTTFSKTYDGATTLSKGGTYYWKASYIKTGGIPGNYSPLESFHINADPSAPTVNVPYSGQVFSTLTPTFRATFVDADIVGYADYPTSFDAEVRRNSDDNLMHSLNETAGLVVGANELTRTAEGTALSYETEYYVRFKYTDSKSAVGGWSAPVIFKPSQPPVATITSPGTTVSSPAFNVTWTYSSPGGKPQGWYHVTIYRDSDVFKVYDSTKSSGTDTSHAIPAGYLINGVNYTIYLYLYDSDNMVSNQDTQAILTDWTAPPTPDNFSVTNDPATASVVITWDQSTLNPTTEFSYYQIYRREAGDTDWTAYVAIPDYARTSYIDYYAANTVNYDYTMTVFKKITGDVDLESAIAEPVAIVLDEDQWFVVGADRSAVHSGELPVSDESHTTPIQQEVFEPLGSTRKTVVRGRTLGAEGTLDLKYTSDEVVEAKKFIDYLSNTEGPHILKSPFGDVWDVEFTSPSFKYSGGGHLATTLTWIEVA